MVAWCANFGGGETVAVVAAAVVLGKIVEAECRFLGVQGGEREKGERESVVCQKQACLVSRDSCVELLVLVSGVALPGGFPPPHHHTHTLKDHLCALPTPSPRWLLLVGTA